MERMIPIDIEPKSVFKFFEEISRIPRETGNEKAVSDWLVEFAKERAEELKASDDNFRRIYKRLYPVGM